MHRDFKELLSILNDEQVKYLVVGGYAVSLHAQPRATKDLDILIKCNRENAAALFRALAEFGAPLEGLKPDDFAEVGSFFRMGTPPVMVDILPEISGVDFDHAWRRRVMETIDAETGLKAAFISADDLIAAKMAAGRAQDLADVEALRKARNVVTTDTNPRRRSPSRKPLPKPTG
jgi:hypothetical protein